MEQTGKETLEKKTNCPSCGLAVWYLPSEEPAQGEELRCPQCRHLLLTTGIRITGTSPT